MRILFPVHALTNNPKSGLHTAIWNMVTGMAKRGHEITVISTWTTLDVEGEAQLTSLGVRVHTIGNFPLHNLDRAAAIACFVAAIFLRVRYQWDWIIILDTTHTPFHRFKLGAHLAIRALAPQTSEIQELLTKGDWIYDRQYKDEEEQWTNRKRPLWYRLCSIAVGLWQWLTPETDHTANVDLLLCQGKDTLSYYEKQQSVRTAYLPNGVQEELFTYPNTKQHSAWTVLFVGRIARRKGVFQLVEAFQECNFPGSQLRIVGKGSDVLTEELRTKIRTNSSVILLGEQDHTEVAKLYADADVVVDPMIYQGFSTVCLEGQFCGKPVIASRFGGTKDFAEDHKTGLLIDPRNVHEIVSALQYLFNNREKATAMGQRGHAIVASQFTWKHVAEKLEQALLAHI